MGGISVLLLMGFLSFMFFTFVAIFLAIIVYEIIAYIFESITIMCMSKNLKYKAPFTAWIPFYHKYLLGKIVGNKVLGVILTFLNIAIVWIGIYCYVQFEMNPILFIIFLLCVFIAFILDIVLSHKIYVNTINQNGNILTILSILTFGILRPIFLFSIRNKVKKTEK